MTLAYAATFLVLMFFAAVAIAPLFLLSVAALTYLGTGLAGVGVVAGLTVGYSFLGGAALEAFLR